MIGRYRKCATYVGNDQGAVGYVCCGLPRNWAAIREKHYILADPPQPVSSRSLNPHHRRQRNSLRRYVYLNGLRLWRVFSDVNQESDVQLVDRIGLGTMFFHLKHRNVRRVLVDRAERLSTDPVELLVLLQDLRSSGIRVIATSHPRELTSDLYLDRLAKHSSPEKMALVRRSLGKLKWRGSLKGAKTHVGRKPFGTRPEERTALLRILDLCRPLPKDQRRTGSIRRSFKQIADMLNEEGIPTRTGKPWTASTVQGIIKRERPTLFRDWSSRPKKSPS